MECLVFTFNNEQFLSLWIFLLLRVLLQHFLLLYVDNVLIFFDTACRILIVFLLVDYLLILSLSYLRLLLLLLLRVLIIDVRVDYGVSLGNCDDFLSPSRGYRAEPHSTLAMVACDL